MTEMPDHLPLAARMRPLSLDEFCGQAHLLGPGKPLRSALESGRIYSIVLWGPPGSGKTTLARLAARMVDAQFLTLSAVLAGVKDIRAAVDDAKRFREEQGKDTILFVDEVHRFNKAQQDAFLPFVEDGVVTFIGATTENPSFELNNALLSRARVHVLRALETADIRRLIDRALDDTERGLGGYGIEMPEETRELLARYADGDARRALNILEMAAELAQDGQTTPRIDEQRLAELVAEGSRRRFDKGGEYFYDQISALHKSIRGSDPDAALYWMARMLDGGCDPLYLARRLVRVASEDIGNADPRALRITLDAWDVQERLGSPEGELALGQAVVYLAVAAKSNAVYKAVSAAMRDVKQQGTREVPMHLRNAPTKLMKGLGYGKSYRYAHDESDAYAAGENYFPEGMQQTRYYWPAPRGLEIRIKDKLDQLRRLDAAKPAPDPTGTSGRGEKANPVSTADSKSD